MDEVLSPEESLAPEYPLVFTPGSGGRVVVAEDRGEIHSACAILRRGLVFPDERGTQQYLAAGLIGSVSTSMDCRGQGLATAVLELAERELLEEGCLLSLLWADSPGFYEARGYQPIGLEVDFVLDETFCLDLPEGFATRKAGPEDYSLMHEMYLQHSRRVERSLCESAALFSTPRMEVFLAEDAGMAVAYTCRGRGHDLDGVVHEWAGSADGVLACIRAHSRAASTQGERGPLFLMCSADAGAVMLRLGELGAPSANGVLGMGKLLDPTAAAALLRSACARPLDILIQDDGGARITCGQRTAEIGRMDWLDLLVSPLADRETLESLESHLQVRFPGLPRTPFLWGLDSI